MNTPAKTRLGPFQILLCVAGAIFALFAVAIAAVVLWVVSSLRLSGDARALRDSLRRPEMAAYDKRVEVNVGWIATGLLRTGLEFAHLDDEARTALGSIRSAEAGVYQRRFNHYDQTDARDFLASDAAMERRGWDRLVGVADEDTFVAIYTPRAATWNGDLKVCFAVVHDGKMVVGSARANPEALARLVMEKSRFSSNHQMRVSRLDVPSPERF
jgi:hypothetical protein